MQIPAGSLGYVLIFVDFALAPAALHESLKFNQHMQPAVSKQTVNLQNRGPFKHFEHIRTNSTTDLLNQVPGTPLHSSCKPGSNWTSEEYTWCQVPWCYAPLLHGPSLGPHPDYPMQTFNCVQQCSVFAFGRSFQFPSLQMLQHD